jgi:hypothetical protein
MVLPRRLSFHSQAFHSVRGADPVDIRHLAQNGANSVMWTLRDLEGGFNKRYKWYCKSQPNTK